MDSNTIQTKAQQPLPQGPNLIESSVKSINPNVLGSQPYQQQPTPQTGFQIQSNIVRNSVPQPQLQRTDSRSTLGLAPNQAQAIRGQVPLTQQPAPIQAQRPINPQYQPQPQLQQQQFQRQQVPQAGVPVVQRPVPPLSQQPIPNRPPGIFQPGQQNPQIIQQQARPVLQPRIVQPNQQIQQQPAPQQFRPQQQQQLQQPQQIQNLRGAVPQPVRQPFVPQQPLRNQNLMEGVAVQPQIRPNLELNSQSDNVGKKSDPANSNDSIGQTPNLSAVKIPENSIPIQPINNIANAINKPEIIQRPAEVIPNQPQPLQRSDSKRSIPSRPSYNDSLILTKSPSPELINKQSQPINNIPKQPDLQQKSQPMTRQPSNTEPQLQSQPVVRQPSNVDQPQTRPVPRQPSNVEQQQLLQSRPTSRQSNNVEPQVQQPVRPVNIQRQPGSVPVDPQPQSRPTSVKFKEETNKNSLDSLRSENQEQQNTQNVPKKSINVPEIPREVPKQKPVLVNGSERKFESINDLEHVSESNKYENIKPQIKNSREIITNGNIKKEKSLSLKSKGDNDSGVDESTQGNEKTEPGSLDSPKSPTKIPGLSRPPSTTSTSVKSDEQQKQSRSTSRSRILKTPENPVEPIKKVPMNKIQVGSAPSPNLKQVRSKIGSLDNATHKPGGGNIKIETKKLEYKVTPRIEAKNEKYVPKGGDKKITHSKLQWNAQSKIGSLQNAHHKPGGGDKKIETIKTEFKAQAKVGSKDNVKHMPGGGDVKITTQKIDIKATSKIGSLDNMKYKPGGGDKKIFDDKDYLKNIEHPITPIQSSQNVWGSMSLTASMSLPAECLVMSVMSADSMSRRRNRQNDAGSKSAGFGRARHPRPFKLY